MLSSLELSLLNVMLCRSQENLEMYPHSVSDRGGPMIQTCLSVVLPGFYFRVRPWV